MSSLFFFPPPTYVNSLRSSHFCSISDLCKKLNIPCRASGEWTERRVEIKYGQNIIIECEPGDWGAVRITVNKSTRIKEAQTALLVLAYVIHDLVAKESIRNLTWSRVPIPRGRMKTGKALSNSERQRLFRNRRSQ